MADDTRRIGAAGVTTRDVAHAAAVSRVTVSRVLNNHHNVDLFRDGRAIPPVMTADCTLPVVLLVTITLSPLSHLAR